MDGQNVVTISVAALVFLGTWYTGRVQLHRIRSEAEQARQQLQSENSGRLVSTATSLIAPLEARIMRLEAELEEQRSRRMTLADQVHDLQLELRVYEKRVLLLEEWIRAQGFDPEQIA